MEEFRKDTQDAVQKYLNKIGKFYKEQRTIPEEFEFHDASTGAKQSSALSDDAKKKIESLNT